MLPFEGETAAEHIKNALTILMFAAVDPMGRYVLPPDQYQAIELRLHHALAELGAFQAIRRRLEQALDSDSSGSAP